MSLKSRKGRLSQLSVIEVNRLNLNSVWPFMLLSIKNADLVAIDLELSGLGGRGRMSAKSIDDRYTIMRDAAQSRSILSIGISTFRHVSTSAKRKRTRFSCQIYNILSLCAVPFTIEPGALHFLSDHHFDFNRLINFGVDYYPSSCEKKTSLNTLLTELLGNVVPIAVHNGLVDLIFLYEHFYAPLPTTFAQFIANIHDWFRLSASTCRLFDSKYIADYHLHMSASYLEYVFRKCQRENASDARDGQAYIGLEFADFGEDMKRMSETIDCSLPLSTNHLPSIDQLCFSFSNHGFCSKRATCTKLHNVDSVLDLEEAKRTKIRNRRRKRRYAQMENGNGQMDEQADCQHGLDTISSVNLSSSFSVEGPHRAGVDSFMTGFSVLYMCRMELLKFGRLPDELANKLPLSGKEIALTLTDSVWTTKTDDHLNIWSKIEKKRKEKMK